MVPRSGTLGSKTTMCGAGRKYRVENSHQPPRRRECKMRRLKSAGPAKRFLSIHAAVFNTFNVERHLTAGRDPSDAARSRYGYLARSGHRGMRIFPPQDQTALAPPQGDSAP